MTASLDVPTSLDGTAQPRTIVAGRGPGVPEHDLPGPRFRAATTGSTVWIEHDLSLATVSDHRLVTGLLGLVADGVLAGQDEFERAFVEVVISCAPSRPAAWSAFYRNSLVELRAGTADFSPVHRRARSLLAGDSVLEVGSCFGLFALQCAQDGFRVCAADICPESLDLLAAASDALGIPVGTRLADARALPFADGDVDTVTLIHLLEHLDDDGVDAAIGEALRVARRRVVIAVPYEDRPSPHFGHLTALTPADLQRWARRHPDVPSRVFADHGGWLVFDHP